MTITNNDLLELEQSLAYVAQQETGAWYQISKNIQRIKPHLETFQESRKEVIDRLSSKKADGSAKSLKNGNVDFGENAEEFTKVFIELMNEEVEFDAYKFPYEKFGDAKLDALKVLPLMEMIVDEQDN